MWPAGLSYTPCTVVMSSPTLMIPMVMFAQRRQHARLMGGLVGQGSETLESESVLDICSHRIRLCNDSCEKQAKLFFLSF